MAHRRAAQYSISFRTRQGRVPPGWLALPLAQNLRAAFYSIRRPAHPRLCTKPQIYMHIDDQKRNKVVSVDLWHGAGPYTGVSALLPSKAPSSAQDLL